MNVGIREFGLGGTYYIPDDGSSESEPTRIKERGENRTGSGSIRRGEASGRRAASRIPRASSTSGTVGGREGEGGEGGKERGRKRER